MDVWYGIKQKGIVVAVAENDGHINITCLPDTLTVFCVRSFMYLAAGVNCLFQHQQQWKSHNG